MAADPRIKAAFNLIVNSGTAGVTYKDLKQRHLHGTTGKLFSLGLIHREKRPGDLWVYVANEKAAHRA